MIRPEARGPGAFGPRAAALLAAVELRLRTGALLASLVLAATGLLLAVEMTAAALVFGSSAAVEFAEPVARLLPAAAIVLLAAAASIPLLRRPSRIYAAALLDKARPELHGQLVLLAEHQAGRTALPDGAGELMAERIESALGDSAPAPREALASERPVRRPLACLGAVLALGLGFLAFGGTRYLEALGEACGARGVGPTRIAQVEPGDTSVDEGESIQIRCRTAGREPRAVTLVAGSRRMAMSRDPAGLWRTSLKPRGSGRYRVEAEGRSGRLEAGPFELRVRPKPLARVESIAYRYPDYTGLAVRESDSPEVDCLLGTLAELRIRTRGAVGSVELRVEPGGTVAVRRESADRWLGEIRVRRVGRYSLWVTPEGGGAPREVARGTITARADLAPTAAALARRLADGRVAIDYRVADDYRLGPVRMVFVAGGKRRVYEVPDAAGRRESQGAVVVPKEVLASADGGFRYRLEAVDTHRPEPNRGASPDREFRVEREVAMAGPVLEKSPLQMGGSHQRPSAPDSSGDDGAARTQTTRPLESLYKPGEDETGKPPPSGSRRQPEHPDDPYMAPSGGAPEDEPPEPKRKPDGTSGSEAGGDQTPGDNGGQGAPLRPPEVNSPRPGGQGSSSGQEGTANGGTQNTPGGTSQSSGGGANSSGGDGGANTRPAEKPPTGAETGVGQTLPERVMPGKVNMDIRPGESRAPDGAAPGPLRTDWGGARPVRQGSELEPADARAPDGSLRSGPAPIAEPAADGRPAPSPPVAAIAPRYRRYVNEYLEALATSPANDR